MQFVLDLNKWRCGSEGPNQLGKGDTCLENHHGYCCCLGLFSKQIDTDCRILSNTEPEMAKYSINIEDNPLLKIVGENEPRQDNVYELGSIVNSDLSSECMGINDEEKTTVKQKIDKLKKTLKKYGHSLKVKNDKLFDSKGRLINANLLINSLDRYTVIAFIDDAISFKEFRDSNYFAKELLRVKGKKGAKIILEKYLDKFTTQSW